MEVVINGLKRTGHSGYGGRNGYSGGGGRMGGGGFGRGMGIGGIGMGALRNGNRQFQSTNSPMSEKEKMKEKFTLATN
ncbi:MAG TPA: hypothetical protein VMU83_19555 [Hanamia sp.]|nr:hypothetical protein [Hanamia sp.]